MKEVDDTRTVPLCADVPSRTVMIGTEVSKEEEDRLLQFLRNNQDVFCMVQVRPNKGPLLCHRARSKHRPEG
jgi:hypothetical protein